MKRSRDILQAQAAPAYGWKILTGSILLTGLAITLSVIAIRFDVPFSGLGAILVTFGGLTWLSIVALRRGFAQFELRRAIR
ncbi:MAG: hypothetical protein V4653_19530 [Pseudomonadota bacterium]